MLNLTSLNQRINYLLTEINKKIENPLTSDLDANGFDILNVNNINLSTINGGVYPPVVATDNLEDTLIAGNSAGANNIDMNNNDVINVKELELNGTSTITDTTGDLVIQPPTNQTVNIGNLLYVDTLNNRVGINVPAPTEDLEIDGNIQMNTGATSKIVFYDNPNAHEHSEIDADGEGVNGGNLQFYTKQDGGSVEKRMTINNKGAIGLGDPVDFGTSGQYLTSQGSTALPTWTTPTLTGYSYVDRVRYTTAGSFTFTKASYPYLRAIRVICVGGGGGGGQTDYLSLGSGTGPAGAGTGGGGGSLAERFYTNIATLSASVSVVVGDGGTGGIGGTSGTPNGTDATSGGSSSFGLVTDAYHTLAREGRAGNRGAETTSAYGASGVGSFSGNVGDYSIRGSSSQNSISFGNNAVSGSYLIASGSNGGDSPYGTGGDVSIVRVSSGNILIQNGGNGYAFGGGGAGGGGASNGAGVSNGANGGNGARGIVIVELYA